MSFQSKNNGNAAKRIYNLNSLSNPVILDIIKNQDNKLNGYMNPLYPSISKNQQNQDKNSLLSITGKQVVCPNNYNRLNNKQNNRMKSDLIKNVKQIKLILQEPSDNIMSLIQRRQQNTDRFANNQTKQTIKFSSQKSLLPQTNNPTYYEDIILNDPKLYNKVISAYKTMQRNIQIKQKSQNYLPQKRFSTNKLNGQQKNQNFNFLNNKDKPKILPKIADNEGKNPQQKKKILYFNIYRQFQLLSNLSNQCIIIPEQQAQYKAFIGKGNNGLLIKSMIKSRPWWCIRTVTDIDNCNLIWTQWKKPKYMKILPNSKYTKNSNNELLYKQKNQDNNLKEIIKTNNKLKSVNKILSESKIKDYYSKFEFKSDQQITKFNKKISDPNFPSLLQKGFPNVQKRNINKNSKLVNHIPGCFQLHSKKLLFANLKRYYQNKKLNVFDYLPETYVISKGLNDPEYQKFLVGWQKHQQQKDNKNNRNIWICKPGENSNRGNGITVASNLNQIKSFITSHSSSNGMCSALIQKYMENPFLYNKRKFDFRCYILITTVNGIVKGYWYEDGYVRTTSKEYNLKNLDNKFIHLTNDAVQKKGQTYGKFQSFNKVSLQDFQKYLEQNYPHLNFKNSFEKMKQMATDLIKSVGKRLNPEKKQFSFQLFGLDYMLDEKLQAYIIQANSNPCIQVQGNVLGKIIPSMLQNMIRVAIDPIFPPPYSQIPKLTKYSPGNVIQQNKFTLVYDSLVDQQSDDQIIQMTKQQEQEQRMMQAEIQRQNQQEM